MLPPPPTAFPYIAAYLLSNTVQKPSYSEEGCAALNDSEKQRLVWPTAGGAHHEKHPEVKRGGIQKCSGEASRIEAGKHPES